MFKTKVHDDAFARKLHFTSIAVFPCAIKVIGADCCRNTATDSEIPCSVLDICGKYPDAGIVEYNIKS